MTPTDNNTPSSTVETSNEIAAMRVWIKPKFDREPMQDALSSLGVNGHPDGGFCGS